MLLLAFLFQVSAAAPSLDEILSKVALNQARSQQMRTSYVYSQRVAVRLRRGGGRIAREEIRSFTVMPQPRGVQKKLDHFEGRYDKAGKLVALERPGQEHGGIDLDAAITQGFGDGFSNDQDSRDGIEADLFPLTAHQQGKYEFNLRGREKHNGTEVFRLAFRPRGSRSIWTGEALIDAAEYQPVFVRTRMSRGIPLAVKALLGTNVKGLGFSITYARFGDVWFPVTYGGEFSLRVLFGYHRNISIDLANSDFKRTQVDSTVAFTGP